ncbi:hypothetical protein VUJ49_16135 [Pseudomonas berkeleyensis]|uniref:Uncharacterized protein n=1 Tax=Pseudomonas berkeleyensis TaxID=2726956 RepID=A0A7G5DIH5_9PSED|nr:hypothetical protein [Pseudomonas berkeleyensis]QMV61550.1 hypothetical protein HS968_16060 [Pseudomonas berkeleyensis]WSO36982.1 hypothetical protein VUJ49_16135 [Pseudomonas berkeleyensis]
MNARLYQVFSALRGVEPKARYLAYLMLERGLVADGEVWDGGVAKLAEAVGYSKTGVSQGLKALVSHRAFTKGKKKTLGRPVETYRLNIKFKAPKGLALSETVCLKILSSESGVFSQLSVTERCLLAQLWVASGETKGRPSTLVGASVLIRVSAVTLAEDVGLHESTVRRLLSMLDDEGFISCVNTDFPKGKILSKENVYFLLGPSTIKDFSVEHVSIMDIPGVLGWFAGNGGSGFDELRRVCGFNMSSAKHRYADLQLLRLDDAAFRRYLFICLCVALSSEIAEVEGELKRVIGGVLREFFQMDDIDSVIPSEGGLKDSSLIEVLLERVAIQLQGEVLQLFSTKGIFREESLLGVSCYPVGRPGMVRLQVNSIYSSHSALRE